jgi:hypothetical protein
MSDRGCVGGEVAVESDGDDPLLQPPMAAAMQMISNADTLDRAGRAGQSIHRASVTLRLHIDRTL